MSRQINEETRKKAEAVLAGIGFTVDEVMNMVLAKVAEDEVFPVELLKPNAETLAAMEDAEKGRNLIRYDSLDELWADLDKDLDSDDD